MAENARDEYENWYWSQCWQLAQWKHVCVFFSGPRRGSKLALSRVLLFLKHIGVRYQLTSLIGWRRGSGLTLPRVRIIFEAHLRYKSGYFSAGKYRAQFRLSHQRSIRIKNWLYLLGCQAALEALQNPLRMQITMICECTKPFTLCCEGVVLKCWGYRSVYRGYLLWLRRTEMSEVFHEIWLRIHKIRDSYLKSKSDTAPRCNCSTKLLQSPQLTK